MWNFFLRLFGAKPNAISLDGKQVQRAEEGEVSIQAGDTIYLDHFTKPRPEAAKPVYSSNMVPLIDPVTKRIAREENEWISRHPYLAGSAAPPMPDSPEVKRFRETQAGVDRARQAMLETTQRQRDAEERESREIRERVRQAARRREREEEEARRRTNDNNINDAFWLHAGAVSPTPSHHHSNPEPCRAPSYSPPSYESSYSPPSDSDCGGGGDGGGGGD